MKTYEELRSSLDPPILEMANLIPADTGLPFSVWISPKGNAKHDVRVKVFRGPKIDKKPVASVAIRPTVHVAEGELAAGKLKLLQKWIEANHEVILRYWDGHILTAEARASIRSIDPRRLHEDAIDPLFQDDANTLYYMTDISKEITGLPFIVWLSVSGTEVTHDVRIWTADHYPALPTEMNCFAIRPKVRVLKGTMDDDDLALLQRWVDLNLPMILKLWEGEIGSFEAIDTTRHI